MEKEITKEIIDSIPYKFKWLYVYEDGVCKAYEMDPSKGTRDDVNQVLIVGEGFTPTDKPIHIKQNELTVFDVFNDSAQLFDMMPDIKFMAVDESGALWGYQTEPTFQSYSKCWDSCKDAVFIRHYHTKVEDYDRKYFDESGTILYESFEDEINKATKDNKLFDELREHLAIARKKHPEFPDNKGFGFAAIAEEGFELMESLGRQLSKLARAINDNESKEACVEEAKDTIITLFRLIQTMRQEEQSNK